MTLQSIGGQCADPIPIVASVVVSVQRTLDQIQQAPSHLEAVVAGSTMARHPLNLQFEGFLIHDNGFTVFEIVIAGSANVYIIGAKDRL